MAKKNQKKLTPKKKKTKKKKPVKFRLDRTAFVLLVLIALVALAGLLTRHMLTKKPQQDSVARHLPQKFTDSGSLTFEIYPKTDIPSDKQKKKPEIPFSGELPKIAIIIDDTGYDDDIIKKFISLDTVLTLSILPQSPFQNTIANLAIEAGYDILLHQPMEPDEYPSVNPGPGKLLSSMQPDEIIRILNNNLDEIPQVKGVNNHMGSKMTQNADQMRQIFTVLKKRNLFFIDSRTTAQTICRSSARLLQVPFAERDVFIDHKHHNAFIETQMNQLTRIAKSHGEAIGIAHPHNSTYLVLRKLLPAMKKSFTFVPVSALVQPAG